MNEVAILKTLGADQSFLQKVWLFELVACGGIAGLLSGIFASFAGWYLSNYFLEVEMPYPYWIKYFWSCAWNSNKLDC
jgi:predicted lysophospholipase L1 biosynthesis ABC-type transport system permease subunit